MAAMMCIEGSLCLVSLRLVLWAVLAGMLTGCRPANDGSAEVDLGFREETISARRSTAYHATVVTSFSPADGLGALDYALSAEDLSVVKVLEVDTAGLVPEIGSFVGVVISLVGPDGSLYESQISSWPVSSLWAEVDSGLSDSPHSLRYSSYYGGSTEGPTTLEFRIEFLTTSQAPVTIRWRPSAYVRVMHSGCANLDGWVDLTLESVANAGVDVPDAEDNGW